MSATDEPLEPQTAVPLPRRAWLGVVSGWWAGILIWLDRVWANADLPLLRRELIEQSTRKRTYFIRIGFAAMLVVPTLMSYASLLTQIRMGTINGMVGMLGQGKAIFQTLTASLIVGVFIFLPAMMSTAFTVEKERNTIGLILITRLSLWTIVLEKYLSRMVPLVSLILISLPLFMPAYALGGITPKLILAGIYSVLLAMLQVGAIGLMLSAFCRSVVAANLLTYFALLVVHVGPVFTLWLVLGDNGMNMLVSYFAQVVSRMTNSNFYLSPDFVVLPFVPFHPLSIAERAGPVWLLLAMGIPSLLLTFVTLILTRVFVRRRAFVAASHPVLWFFQKLDSLFFSANKRFGNVVLTREASTLPAFDPLAWRETAKRSLGQIRYLIRVFVALEGPVVILVVLLAGAGDGGSTDAISMLQTMVWLVVTLLLSSTASTLVAGERSRQTLDTLLTTPLVSADILEQKMRGVQRLMWICSLPLLTCIIFRAIWQGFVLDDLHYSPNRVPFSWWQYALTQISVVVIYLPMISWVSFWIGLKMKSTARAMMTALFVIVAWSIGLFVLMIMFLELFENIARGSGLTQEESWYWIMMISPFTLPAMCEMNQIYRMSSAPLLPAMFNALIYGGLLFWVRRRCLTHADRLLGRIPRQEDSEVTPHNTLDPDTRPSAP